MEKCRIHTITGKTVGGLISDNQVYPDSKDALFYDFLDPYLLPIESCGKWGLMNANTGELAVPLLFKYTGALVNGASHAVKNGLHGYIDRQGKTVLPFQYDDACDKPSPDGYFAVKRGKWGVVNGENEPILPFVYDRIDLDGCFDLTAGWFMSYWGISAIRDRQVVLFDRYGEILEDHLTTHPRGYTTHPQEYGDYMILQRKRKFGVACRDGRLITNVTMLKREAIHLIQKLEGAC